MTCPGSGIFRGMRAAQNIYNFERSTNCPHNCMKFTRAMEAWILRNLSVYRRANSQNPRRCRFVPPMPTPMPVIPRITRVKRSECGPNVTLTSSRTSFRSSVLTHRRLPSLSGRFRTCWATATRVSPNIPTSHAFPCPRATSRCS